MTRKLIGTAVVLALAVVLPPAVNDAQAQCATGCVSSSSCDGSGRSGCSTACGTRNGVPFCSCQDSECGTQLLPVVLREPAGAVLISSGDERRPREGSLVVDCHGNVLDVRFSTAAGVAVLPDLRSIPLQRARPVSDARLAVRE